MGFEAEICRESPLLPHHQLPDSLQQHQIPGKTLGFWWFSVGQAPSRAKPAMVRKNEEPGGATATKVRQGFALG